jgi:DNA polymerase III alpha subunit (gram-positive type)
LLIKDRFTKVFILIKCSTKVHFFDRYPHWVLDKVLLRFLLGCSCFKGYMRKHFNEKSTKFTKNILKFWKFLSIQKIQIRTQNLSNNDKKASNEQKNIKVVDNTDKNKPLIIYWYKLIIFVSFINCNLPYLWPF